MPTGAPPSRSQRGASVELLLTLVFIAVGLGWWLQSNPIRLAIKASAQTLAGAPAGVDGADVLIVLPRTSEAQSWEQFNPDQAWLNAVEQEVGEFQLSSARELTRGRLDSAAWTIVPANAARELDATQIQTLQNWVQDGGVLILEQPEGPWRSIIGAQINIQRGRQTRRVTSFDGSVARGRAREHVVAMPLQTTIVPYSPADLARGRDYQVLMEIDGNPGIVAIQMGRGRVFLLLFDFARAATASQQGTPAADLTVPRPDTVRLPPALTVTSALATNTEPREAMVPWIDLLERNIFYLADLQRPVARLWMFPGRYRGALLATHSESGVGPMVEFMPDWEHAHDQRSTVLSVAGSVPPEVLTRIRRKGSDVQLAWVPGEAPMVPDRAWGVGRFRPIRRAMTLDEQLSMLSVDLRPYAAATSSRSIDGVWPLDYFRAFAMLEAAGVRLDSSYGPAPGFLAPGDAHAGYIFGTGLPFRPLDRHGNRYRQQQLPFTFTDGNPGYSSAVVRRLLTESSDAFHTVVAGDWRPDTMTRHPSYDALEGWRSAFTLAESQGLWIGTLGEYAEFLQYREQAALRSTFNERRLNVQVRIPEVRRLDDGRDVDLVPSVSFPSRFRGRPVEHVWLNGAPVDVFDLFMSGDRALHVIPLPPGDHRIEIYYGSLADPSP